MIKFANQQARIGVVWSRRSTANSMIGLFSRGGRRSQASPLLGPAQHMHVANGPHPHHVGQPYLGPLVLAGAGLAAKLTRDFGDLADAGLVLVHGPADDTPNADLLERVLSGLYKL